MSIVVHKNYNELFSIDNIFLAWRKFRRGKSKKIDVSIFESHLEDNIFNLHSELQNQKYKHGCYSHFVVIDSKKRNIYKAKVKDRIIHQIIFDYLNEIFEHIFINDSYSSRINKGSHKAIKELKYYLKIENNDVYILKCDIKKYFDNIDHNKLLKMIKCKVKNKKILCIIQEIINSYTTENKIGKGIPLGNVTSQIFANIYLNNLDYFIKKRLKIRFYIRYNDDFILICKNKQKLLFSLEKINDFTSKLLLEIPHDKVSIRKLRWGIDFLGYTILPDCILIRNSTKQKIFQRINEFNFQTYFSLLGHCNSYRLKNKLKCKIADFSVNM
ncbi:MAG: reverse transcriptase/maturase family protein [bacterium]